MSRLSLSSVAVAALLAMGTPAPVAGFSFGTYDSLVYMTFSKPVQVPGVTLGAGTYRFRLANPDTSRNVFQVLSRDGKTVFAMFHTIPDMRMSVTSEATVSFRETPAGVPPAVRSLFYGGEHRGYEFVYPRGGPVMTVAATAAPQPEITYAPIANSSASAAENRSLAAETPNTAAVAAESSPEPSAPAVTAEAAAEPADASAAEQAAPASAPEQRQAAQERQELPHTASSLPLVAIAGMSSILAGLGLGLIRRRV